MTLDACKFVDPFFGNGETDRFFDDGLASKWFYIKALCGNTVPHATLPFGKMSVGAYSGAYPTGYGTHYPNSCGGIKKLSDIPVAKGFSHLHQSGTGAIRYYYNYAVAMPFYGEDISLIHKNEPLTEEEARPGYYKARLRDTLCELSVDGGVALHRYTFDRDGGRVAVDFSNNGLEKSFGVNHSSVVKNPEIKILSDCAVAFSGDFSGVKLYFYIKAESVGTRARIFRESEILSEKATTSPTPPYGVIFDFSERSVELKVAYSTVSHERAMKDAEGKREPFDAACKKAYDIWNKHLAAFQIDTPSDELKEKFYSCLYHSTVKPCDLGGESVLGASGDVVVDLATLWDQYKTALPLIFLAYPGMGGKIAKGILNISRTLGKIPCSFGLSDVFPCEEQAKMLGIYALCDAFHFGIGGVSIPLIEECIERELGRDDYKDFLEGGYFERYTHILDVTDACFAVAKLTKNESLRSRLLHLTKNWSGAYSADGYMSEKSKYYEGDRYTYSFRLQSNMDERIALAGGVARFEEMLDDFFGFSGESVRQLTHLNAFPDIEKCRYHRFEGFNNECDMETPYAYIYAKCHDKLCEIIKECTHRSFGLGRHGLAGNNDSGGLSSMFVWNTLGLFPISGSGMLLIGAPQIEGAKIALSSGKTLTVTVERENPDMIYVSRVEWGGKEITDYRISVEALMNGGELKFYMM